MKRQDVLKHPATVLTEAQRQQFFDEGFLVLPGYVPEPWLVRLRAAMVELLERSRYDRLRATASTSSRKATSASDPRLHRIASPQDQHPVFWEFMTDPVMTDLAADVVGPDVKFHHAKLNVKSGKGTQGLRLAPGHSRLAAHRLQPGHDRHLHRRLHARAGTADGRRRQPRRAAVLDVRRGPQLRGQDREKDLGWLTDDKIRRITGGPGRPCC